MEIDRREFLKQAGFMGLGLALSSFGLAGCKSGREIGETAVLPGTSESLGYRPLGKTGIKISELAFGSHMTDENVADPVGRKKQILRALDRGVNLYDIYDAHYHQYKPMSRIIKPRREEFLISVGSFIDINEQPPKTALKLAAKEIDDLLTVFQTDRIDLFRFCYLTNRKEDSKVKYEAAMRAKEKGKIRAFGIAAHSDEEHAEAFELFEHIDFILLPYNFHHDKAAYARSFPMAIERQVGMIAMKPFAAGSLLKATIDSTDWLPQDLSEYERLKELQAEKGADLAGAILRHILSNPNITCAIPAMNTVVELDANISAVAGKRLSSEDMALLWECDRIVRALKGRYLSPEYRWLETEWA